MYHTGIRDRFSASHILIGDFGSSEAEQHQHDYVPEWALAIDKLDGNGFGVDIDLLTAELRRISGALDGSHLNDLGYFRDDGAGRPRQPSVENLAEHINTMLLEALRRAGADVGRITESRIQLWESDTAWAGHSVRPES